MYIGLKVKWWPGGTLVSICEYFYSKKKKKIATMIPPLPSEHLRLERW